MNHSLRTTLLASAAGLLVFAGVTASQPAQAIWTEARIGDIDGFGYSPALPGLQNAVGAAADTNGNGVLEVGEFLPDLNQDGLTQFDQRDDFDNRSGEANSCGGCTLGAGMAGLGFTDIALSRSYDASSAANDVFDANTGTRGAGGAFPAPPSNTLSNQPGFAFDFFVATGDIVAGQKVFLNVVFGDYDVAPATIEVTLADGTVLTLPLTLQNNNQGEDGLIQAASTKLDFDDVFNAVVGGYEADLKVDFIADREPYTAFDYVELSATRIAEPGSLALIGLGLAGLGLAARRRRKA